MTTLHVGCAGFPVPRSRYARKLAFVEIDAGSPAPAPKVIARWKQEAGESMVWSVVAPAALWGERDWPLRDEKKTQAEIDRLVNVVKPLGARAMLLRTPPSIRPGTVSAKRFVALAEKVRKMAPVVAWEPTGVWEREDAQAVVADLGIVVVSDPLHDEIEGEPIVYARMRGLGADRRYHQGRLEDLLVSFSDAEEVFVVFDTQQSFSEATRLRTLVEGLAAEGEDEESAPEAEDEEDLDDEDAGESDEDSDEDEDFDEDEDSDEDENDDADEDDASDEDGDEEDEDE